VLVPVIELYNIYINKGLSRSYFLKDIHCHFNINANIAFPLQLQVLHSSWCKLTPSHPSQEMTSRTGMFKIILTTYVVGALLYGPVEGYSVVRKYGSNGTLGLDIDQIITQQTNNSIPTWGANSRAAFGKLCANFAQEEFNEVRTNEASSNETVAMLVTTGNPSQVANTLGPTALCSIISDMMLVAGSHTDTIAVYGQYDIAGKATVQIGLAIHYGPPDRAEFAWLANQTMASLSDAAQSKRLLATRADAPELNFGNRTIWVGSHEDMISLIRSGNTLPDLLYDDTNHAVVRTSEIIRGVVDTNDTHSKRFFCGRGTQWYNYWGDGKWTTHGAWMPASNCEKTGLDSAGGYITFSLGYSISYSESADFGGQAMLDAFGGSFGFGFEVTEEYDYSESYSCNVPGSSVGQIYTANNNGYGYAYRQLVTETGCGEIVYGGVDGPNYGGAPGVFNADVGCSAGAGNVACESYDGWQWYSIWSKSPPNST
jgi:hypothetical protein